MQTGKPVNSWTFVVTVDPAPGLDGIYECFECEETWDLEYGSQFLFRDEDGVEVLLHLKDEKYRRMNRAQLTREALKLHAEKRKEVVHVDD